MACRVGSSVSGMMLGGGAKHVAVQREAVLDRGLRCSTPPALARPVQSRSATGRSGAGHALPARETLYAVREVCLSPDALKHSLWLQPCVKIPMNSRIPFARMR